MFLVSGLDGRLPFTVEDANRPETEIASSDDVQYKRVLLDTRLDNRIIDLRVRNFSWQFYSDIKRFLDSNKSGGLQATTCHWPLVPRLLRFSGLH